MPGSRSSPCCAPSSCTCWRQAATRRRSIAAARAARRRRRPRRSTSPSSGAAFSAAPACRRERPCGPSPGRLRWSSRGSRRVRSRAPPPALRRGRSWKPRPSRSICSPRSPRDRCARATSWRALALIPRAPSARVPLPPHGRRDDGQGGEPLQAAGVRRCRRRDLRGPRLESRLRAARRRAQAQRQGGVVAGGRDRTRRRGRDRCGDHHASGGLGGLRAPRRLHRPARRLQELQAALPRRRRPRRALPRVRRRADRGAAVQPHVQDPRRSDGGHGARRLPPSGDGAGHLRQLPQRRRDVAPEDPLRHRADREVVPQRDHARQLPLPDARVRADGARVLRAARRGRPLVRTLARRAPALVHRPRSRARAAPRAATRGRRARPLREGVLRHRVPVPLRVGRARGDRQPHRLRPPASRRAQRQGLELLRRGAARALPAVRDRAVGRGRSLDPRLPPRCLRRRRDRGRDAHRAPAPSETRAVQGGRLPAPAQGWATGARAAHLRRAPAAIPRRLRSGGLDRAALSPPGRGRHTVRDHRRPPDHAGRHRHAPRPRCHHAGAHPRGSSGRGAARQNRLRRTPMARPQARAARPAPARARRYIYWFGGGRADGRADMKALLGGKGANLAEMARLGLPVPPGFTISTEVCTHYYAHGGSYPPGLKERVPGALARVEKAVGRRFGDPEKPLLVSVRSGARASMPGMMDTILNLGLNDRTVEGLARETGNPRFAYDCYRRFVQMYGDGVLGLRPETKTERDPFELVLEEKKRARRVKLDTDLDADALRELVAEFKALVRTRRGVRFPEDPEDQLWGAIGAVFGSWMNERALVYRRLNTIPDTWGTAVNVQAMVFGNMGPDSGTGVAFTRDPATGENVFYGEFLMNAQGEDVVAGVRTPLPIAALERENPKVYAHLVKIRRILERHYRDVMDIEFTIQQGTLYMLQCRVGKRTALAAVRIALDMVRERLITRDEALRRVEPEGLEQLLRPTFDAKAKDVAVAAGRLLARGLAAGPGAATGRIAFHAEEAEAHAARGESVILVRIETSPEDLRGMAAPRGILTARGGMTSHAALVGRQMGKVCVVGGEPRLSDHEAGTLRVSGRDVVLRDGDEVAIDGTTGAGVHGGGPTAPSEVVQVLIDRTRDPATAPVYRMV